MGGPERGLISPVQTLERRDGHRRGDVARLDRHGDHGQGDDGREDDVKDDGDGDGDDGAHDVLVVGS